MAMNKYSSSYSDEDYIDLELFSSPNFFCYSITSPSPSRDFEFKMCPFNPLEKQPETSPADELFFNGKILPLHLRPRSQSLQKLFNYTLPPPQLSNLSEFPTEDNSVGNQNQCFFIGSYHPLKKCNWSGKLKQILLGQKLKASTSFIKSLFTKSSDEFSCTKSYHHDASSTTTTIVQPEKGGEDDHFDDLKYMKISKKSPFGEKQRHSLASSSSSSSSSRSSSGSSNSTFSVSSSNDLQLVKTTSMMSAATKNNNFEIEKSIEGAIAYCKKSYQQQQKLICGAEVEVCSLPVSTNIVTCGD